MDEYCEVSRPQYELKATDITPTLEASFWSLVKIDWQTGCWLWQGMETTRGYGRFKVMSTGRGGTGSGIRISAHRIAYALAWGYVPATEGLAVMHTCHNVRCVAPHHLEIGTDQQNLKDRDDRRRARAAA